MAIEYPLRRSITHDTVAANETIFTSVNAMVERSSLRTEVFRGHDLLHAAQRWNALGFCFQWEPAGAFPDFSAVLAGRVFGGAEWGVMFAFNQDTTRFIPDQGPPLTHTGGQFSLFDAVEYAVILDNSTALVIPEDAKLEFLFCC